MRGLLPLLPFLLLGLAQGVPREEAWWQEVARRFQGHPYLWGGNGPGGFDCSGLVVYIYRALGFSLPRTSQEMWSKLPPVQGEVAPGDLLFFGERGRVDHLAIYLGGGLMFHASGRWGKVVVEPWTALRGRYMGARTVGTRTKPKPQGILFLERR